MIYHPNTSQLFYTGLDETSIIRSHLSLYHSEDKGEHWSLIKTIYSGSSAYSALTLLPDQSIGLLYEWANKTDFIFQPDYITFTRIFNQTK